MNTAPNTKRSRFSPKVIVVILLASLVVLFSGLYLFHSVLSGNVLESITFGEFRFDLCGDDSLSRIVVYKNDKKTATVTTSSVGNNEDHYGVTVIDLNLDSYPDLLVTKALEESEKRCDAWLWNNAIGTFRSEETLSGVLNPTINEDYGCITSHRYEKRDAGSDSGGTYYEETEIYSVYCAIDNDIVEFARYEFVYYTKHDIYVYRVTRFDEDEKQLSSFSDDSWLYPHEVETFSLTEKVSSDMEEHKADYKNAKANASSEETAAGSDNS